MKTLMKGNEAIAEAAIRAGCRAYFGYPITPQNEIPEYFSKRMPEVGGVFVQAESELAAINMVYGAASTGKRVMTSSSSPGIALKQEGITYTAGARLPAVIVSVSRGGPGLGGILPSQGDYYQATRGGGNGDYYAPVYAASSIQEATDLVQIAFNTADKYRCPVMLLVDGLIGQMMEPVEIREIPRYKADHEEWAASGNAARRGRRNVITSLDLDGAKLEQRNILIRKTYEEIVKNEIMYETGAVDGDEFVIVAYGTPARIAINAVAELRRGGIKAALFRPITLRPFPGEALRNLPSSVKNVMSLELSMGQMVDDVRLALNGKLPVHFFGRTGGMLFEVEDIVAKVKEIVGGSR